MKNEWLLLDDAQAIAASAAQAVHAAARQAIDQRGRFLLVLAGGTTPEACYRLLRTQPADWSHWHIYFGDERCLPVDDPSRNSLMARQAWLDHVAIPPVQIHPIAAELGPERAAADYHRQVQKALPFDLVLLGMGEDGHTASLFPGQLHELGEQWALPVYDAPKPPAERISLSRGALCQCRELLVLISGAGKREAVGRWRSGAALPIAELLAKRPGRIMIDRAAMPETV